MNGAEDLRRRRRLFKRRKQRRDVEASMTVTEHLGELRTRLVYSAVAFVGISVIAFILYDPIEEFFRRPLCSVDRDLLGIGGCKLFFNKLIGGFQFRLKMTALVGIAFSSPVWLYQLWAYVVPALTSKERRYAFPFMASSVVLFLAGCAIAYLVMPTGIGFLLKIGGENLEALPTAEEYLNFVGFMMLGFGLMFELPLLLFFLGLVGVLSIQQLRRGRRHALVGIAALAAVITPSQDPYTMLILLVPLYALYELTILLLAIVLRRRRAASGPRAP